jgi:hypothetical protein
MERGRYARLSAVDLITPRAHMNMQTYMALCGLPSRSLAVCTLHAAKQPNERTSREQPTGSRHGGNDIAIGNEVLQFRESDITRKASRADYGTGNAPISNAGRHLLTHHYLRIFAAGRQSAYRTDASVSIIRSAWSRSYLFLALAPNTNTNTNTNNTIAIAIAIASSTLLLRRACPALFVVLA